MTAVSVRSVDEIGDKGEFGRQGLEVPLLNQRGVPVNFTSEGDEDLLTPPAAAGPANLNKFGMQQGAHPVGVTPHGRRQQGEFGVPDRRVGVHPTSVAVLSSSGANDDNCYNNGFPVATSASAQIALAIRGSAVTAAGFATTGAPFMRYLGP